MGKRIILLIAVLTLALTSLTACAPTVCQISGCDNEIYKENLCRLHFYAAEGANILDDVAGAISK